MPNGQRDRSWANPALSQARRRRVPWEGHAGMGRVARADVRAMTNPDAAAQRILVSTGGSMPMNGVGTILRGAILTTAQSMIAKGLVAK